MNLDHHQAVSASRMPLKVTAAELPNLLERCSPRTRVLSLDCFDTLLWRQTATPIDVFYELQASPPFRRLGFTGRMRAGAEAKARQVKGLRARTSEVDLAEIYRAAFPGLTAEEVGELSEAEVAAEARACYAMPETVALIRAAKARGLRVVIVSDTYFDAAQLRSLLEAVLPDGVAELVDAVFCSSEHGMPKSLGLFDRVMRRLGVRADAILHVGDNEVADAESPRGAGIAAVHLLHGNEQIEERSRLYVTAACVLDPKLRDTRSLPSPFHGLLSSRPWPTTGLDLLGYASAGPIMYAFGRFLLDELDALRAAGASPKPLFLMRDAHLPRLVCQALAGAEVGPEAFLSRFAAYAASFRSAEDVDRYLATRVGSRRFDAIVRQLLLPEAMAQELLDATERAANPAEEFSKRARKPRVVETVIEQSRQYRARLFRYLERVLGVRRGDTVVLVDLGYQGTVQQQLGPVLRDELGVEVVGRYLIASPVPGWEGNRRGLVDPTLVDDRAIAGLIPYVAVLEDICTSDEGSVVDYADDGTPIHGERSIDAAQYERIRPLQARCLDFARDAQAFFSRTGRPPSPEALRVTALGELGRLIFFPSREEIEFLDGFRLDMNLATADSFSLFDLDAGLTSLRRRGLFFLERDLRSMRMNYPVELRAAGLELSLALMTQHRYSLSFSYRDSNLRRESIQVMILRDDDACTMNLDAQASHDGYFTLLVPVGVGAMNIGVVFGQSHSWLQLESIERIAVSALFKDDESQHTHDVEDLRAEDMVERGPGIYECLSPSAFVFIPGTKDETAKGRFVIRIVYRPLAPAA